MNIPLPIPTAPTRDKPSSLWFLAGFLATVLAGIAKIAIANHYNPDSVDNSG